MPKTKAKWDTVCENAYGEPFHYFVTSVAEWQTGRDLDRMVAYFKTQSFDFWVFKVELPANAGYQIKSYVPQVDDDKLHLVAHYKQQK